MTSEKVTREELYERVWKTPMSTLADQYGVSDVALAKTCARLNVPRPGRGYWARLAAGERLKRPPLPKAGPDHDEWTFLRRVEHPISRAARPAPPLVRVPGDLRRAHNAIRDLGEAFANAKPDQHERLVVGPAAQPTFAVTLATHRRALLLLNGLAQALAARGTRVTLESANDECRLVAQSAGETMAVSLVERLEREDHVQTAEEQARAAKGYSYGIPKYDYSPGGRLQITLHGVELQRSSWSDTDNRRLDASLGSVVLAVEAVAEHRKARRVAQADEERRRLEQRREEEERERQRRREAEELERQERERAARRKHQEVLVQSLKEMAQRWSEAQRLRAFLDAFSAALPAEGRDGAAEAWLKWAARCADEIDPLSRPGDVVRPVAPPG